MLGIVTRRRVTKRGQPKGKGRVGTSQSETRQRHKVQFLRLPCDRISKLEHSEYEQSTNKQSELRPWAIHAPHEAAPVHLPRVRDEVSGHPT